MWVGELERTDLFIDEKVSKWRNLFFDKQGKCFKGDLVFDTKQAAKQRVGVLENAMKRGIIDGIEGHDGKILTKDYGWSMQMPVFE